MNILALDTASPICAVCLTRGGQVLAKSSEIIGTGHAERMMPMVQETMALASLNYSDLDLVAVSIGPGSFTGVRTGLAAAKGFAQALTIPAVGISTLEAIAFEAQKSAGKIALRVVIDAKRGEVHTQDFAADGRPEGAAVLLSLEDAKGGLGDRALAGNGGILLETGAQVFLPGAATASIAVFAEIAENRKTADINSLTIMPLYLRGADVKPQSGFALARTKEN